MSIANFHLNIARALVLVLDGPTIEAMERLGQVNTIGATFSVERAYLRGANRLAGRVRLSALALRCIWTGKLP